jgi:hypothetical protein
VRAILGVGPDEPITLEMHDRLIDPADRAAAQAARARVLGAGDRGEYRVEFRFHPVGGGARWIESVGRGVFEDGADGPRATRVIGAMIDAVRNDAGTAVARRALVLPVVPPAIPSIHFRDALDLVFRATGEDARSEPDLSPAHERWLGEWARREHGSDFLFVVGYPMVKRPFYTHPDLLRPAYSNSFDLLFRGVELVTGGQRLHRHEDYLTALSARGLSQEPFAGYLEAFKHGMPPHGGFAIGLERWISRLCDLANLREAALFPRDLHRLTPSRYLTPGPSPSRWRGERAVPSTAGRAVGHGSPSPRSGEGPGGG